MICPALLVTAMSETSGKWMIYQPMKNVQLRMNNTMKDDGDLVGTIDRLQSCLRPPARIYDRRE